MTCPAGTPAHSGLRERKRAATRRAIESTAISLALEHGYDGVTVEMICEKAMVSQRTFFNYFGSKEGVVLGATPPMPTDGDISAFIDGTGNVLGDFVAMIAAAAREHEPDPEMFTARRTLVMRTPELLSKETAQLSEFQDRFAQIVMARYRAHGRDPADDPSLDDEARMVVALAAGVMHHVRQRFSGSSRESSSHELLRASLALVRRITEDGSTSDNPEDSP